MVGGELGRLYVTVDADTSTMQRKIASDAESVGRRGGKIAGLAMGGALAVGLGATAAVAGVGMLAKEMFSWAQAGQEAVNVGRTTSAILKSTGADAWTSAAGVDALATSISNKTGVDDEAIATGANLLLTFKNVQNQAGKGAAIFDRATAAAVDLSKAGFGSIDSASKMLGKALNDPVKGVTALSRAGVTFTDQQKEQIKTLVASGKTLQAQKLIMKEVESQVGGVAQATKSPMEALQTTFDNLKEAVGTALLPTLQKLADTIGPIMDKMQAPLSAVATALGDTFITIIDALAPALGPLSQMLGSIAQTVGGVLATAFKTLAPVMQTLAPILTQVVGLLGEQLQRVFAAIAPSIPVLAAAFGKIVTALMPLLPMLGDLLVAFAPLIEVIADLAAEAAPVMATFITLAVKSGILQAAISLLAAVVKFLAPIIKDMGQKWLVVQGILVKVWEAIFNAIRPVVEWITNTVVPWINDATKAISKSMQGPKVTAEKVWQAISDAVSGAVDFIKGVWDGLLSWLDGIVERFTSFGTAIVDGIRNGISGAWDAFTGWVQDKINSLPEVAKKVLGIASPSKVFATIGGNVVEGFAIGLKGLDKVNKDTAAKFDAAAKASEDRINKWVQRQKDQLAVAVDAWKDYKQQAMNAMTGGLNIGDAWRRSEDSAQRAQDAYDKLVEAQKAAAAPDATDSQKAAVGDAQAAYDLAKTQIVTFEQAWNDLIAQSNIAGNMLQSIQNAVAGQPGADLLMQQLFQMDPATIATIGAQLVGSTGEPTSLLGTITSGLAQQNVWAGNVATSMANQARGAGVAQAKAALLGIDKQVQREEEHLKRIGGQMGDGLVVGFESKEGAFKAAVRRFIRATEQELGINSPSKVFAQIGAYTAEGFNRGFDGAMMTPQVGLDAAALRRVYAPGATAQVDAGSTSVRVFIGDRELTDIVRTEVGSSNDDLARQLAFGRR